MVSSPFLAANPIVWHLPAPSADPGMAPDGAGRLALEQIILLRNRFAIAQKDVNPL